MKSKATFLISAILISLLSCTALAQETSISLKHNGAEGRWFPKAMVDKMQADLIDLDACREREIRLNIKLDLRLESIKELKAAVASTTLALDTSKHATSVAEKAMEASAERELAAEARAIDAEKKMNAWYRHPVTLVGAGALAVVIIEVVLYAVLK